MIELKELTKYYNRKSRGIIDVSLEIKEGEIFGVLGPNGSGKSTLIRAASGVVPIASGQVSVDGRDLNGMSHSRRAKILAVSETPKTEYLWYESILSDPEGGDDIASMLMMLRFMKASHPAWQ